MALEARAPVTTPVAEKSPLRTLEMKPRHKEAIKPAELIQITGHHELTLNAEALRTHSRR
jgi:hypothetical protein